MKKLIIVALSLGLGLAPCAQAHQSLDQVKIINQLSSQDLQDLENLSQVIEQFSDDQKEALEQTFESKSKDAAAILELPTTQDILISLGTFFVLAIATGILTCFIPKPDEMDKSKTS